MARLLPMGSIGDERLEDLRSRLDAIAEELADLGYAKLAEAARLAQAGERSRGARQADDAGTGTGSAEADAAERRHRPGPALGLEGSCVAERQRRSRRRRRVRVTQRVPASTRACAHAPGGAVARHHRTSARGHEGRSSAGALQLYICSIAARERLRQPQATTFTASRSNSRVIRSLTITPPPSSTAFQLTPQSLRLMVA